MNILSDTISFIQSLSFIDIIFFFAVLVLMLLIITLIYFIKENNEDDLEENTPLSKLSSSQDEISTLKEITEALSEAEEPAPINFSKYEEEQEEKAIISYEELLNHKNDFALNYSEEENIADDLTVKKVDLDHLLNKENKNTSELKMPVMVISYEKEEAFLEALKTLQQKLN